ncbi:glycerophosphoryl diester phosphodiesterase [Desulfacinum hydrothermale DSM 13146]|uniref:Glycerophosphoryl diester phosphodiesterase n=1 Tax=Desulfacinum hydrothermale DSM 13146 TaxID=1121390 RepID=A0A1W1XES5_9BACT|nr:glycerophosphodiester phosphodiesterase family protein [Desulfacinum hydrothermale]SMC22565.1 glycerophosphoryl diester phosphodiesterase [Desulfacinum hydrothermale DSM 13146]
MDPHDRGSWDWRDGWRSPWGPPLVGAHRGGRALASENTLAAAMISFAVGADFWEMDVQLSADGVPVVIHDPTLERTSNAARLDPRRDPWNVSDYLLRELEGLDMDEHPPGGGRPGDLIQRIVQNLKDPGDETHHRISTLREALLFTKSLGWRINVEIKGDGKDPLRLAEETVRIVRETGMARSVLISSFREEVVVRVKALEPTLPAGIIVKEDVEDPVAAVRRLGADTYHPKAELVGEEALARLRQAGIPVLVWTVNEAHQMKTFMDRDVFAIITDRPHVLAQLKRTGASAHERGFDGGR